jgi:hypothetical protein
VKEGTRKAAKGEMQKAGCAALSRPTGFFTIPILASNFNNSAK